MDSHQLRIIERRNGTQITYDYELDSPALNILGRYESKPIASYRQQYVEALYREIESRWYSVQEDVDAFAAEQLGYILDLMPEVNAYAAKFSLDFPGNGPDEMFIGIVGTLADAQIWKTQKLAKQAIEQYYADTILQQLDEAEAVRVNIKRLERSGDNELKTEVVETFHFYREH
jgi:hypothetical protein